MIFKLVIFSSNHRLQIRFSCFVLYMCVFIFLTPRLKLYHPCSWRNSMRLISTCKTTNKIQSRFKPYQNMYLRRTKTCLSECKGTDELNLLSYGMDCTCNPGPQISTLLSILTGYCQAFHFSLRIHDLPQWQ